jgi:hypothetical protein
MSQPEFQWEEPIEIEAGRTCDQRFYIYQPNKSPASIHASAVMRFKLSEKASDETPLLDIDSVEALEGGSIVTIVGRGTQDVTPAEIRVTFDQDDTDELDEGEYFGELGVVDSADGNRFKRCGYGTVLVRASPGGDVGLT